MSYGSGALPALRGYRWVDDLASSDVLRAAACQGVIPVLAPASGERRNRWAEVLAWYGLAPTTTVEPVAAETSTTHGRDVVVAIGAEVAPVAEVYATVRQRPFHLIAPEQALDEIVAFQDAASLLLVGERHQFDRHALRRLAQEIHVPWGLITAWDLPGLTFAMAKQLAAAQAVTGECGYLDAPRGTVQTVGTESGFGVAEQVDRDTLHRVVQGREWYALAILAHGEGGHVTLNDDHSVVLCGLLGDEEQSLDGKTLRGCRVDQQTRHCKRVIHPDPRIVAFREIRARHLQLFTCVGFSVVGEPYPSTISAILSAADGYAASILSTSQNIYPDPVDPAVALAMLRQGEGIGAMAGVLNDLEARRSGARPYLLFGDPAGIEPSWIEPAPDGRLTLSDDGPLTLVQLDRWATRGAVGIIPPSRERRLVRGESGAIILSSSARDARVVQLTDQTDRLVAQIAWFTEIRRRLRRVEELERITWREFQPQLACSPEFQTAARQLLETRMRLDEHLTVGLRTCDAVRHFGAWDETLDELAQQCRKYVGLWDRTFATLFAEHLVLGAEFNIFGDRFAVIASKEECACGYCGSALCRWTLAATVEGEPHAFRTSCPICGDREAWLDGAVRLRLAPLIPMQPGTIAALTVNFDMPPADVLAAAPPGVLVVELREKGTARVLFRQIEEVTSGPHAMSVAIPSHTIPELHRLLIAWVHGLEVSLLRQRWPAFEHASMDVANRETVR